MHHVGLVDDKEEALGQALHQLRVDVLQVAPLSVSQYGDRMTSLAHQLRLQRATSETSNMYSQASPVVMQP
jgi:hypothetical protein